MPERLVVHSTGEVIGDPVQWAHSRLERARGLLGRRGPDDGALLLRKAMQVHTFGMRYAIDVVFCDRELKVLHVVPSMVPRRITKWVRGAHVTIEVGAGKAAHVAPGDVLELVPY